MHQFSTRLLRLFCASMVCTAFCGVCSAWAADAMQDQLITAAHYQNGDVVPYLLTTSNLAAAKYAVILMPGGVGNMNLKMEDGKVSFTSAGNFLIRSRGLFVDSETVAISTDSTGSAERMGAILEDIQKKYPAANIYILGTSRSTFSTIELAQSLDGKVAGFIHTSSMNAIASFDTTKLKSRQLIVHHYNDGCKETTFGSAKRNHDRYGTEFIEINGGGSQGNPCEAFGHHGYNGIERETVEKIKAWIKRG